MIEIWSQLIRKMSAATYLVRTGVGQIGAGHLKRLVASDMDGEQIVVAQRRRVRSGLAVSFLV